MRLAIAMQAMVAAILAVGLVVAGTAGARSDNGSAVLDDFADFDNNRFEEMFINRWRVPSANVWSSLDYSGEGWPSGGGVWELLTRHGPGFKFVATDEMRTHAGAKSAQIADIDHLVDQEAYLGTVTALSGMFMLPRAGNPDGFPPTRDWNALWEFGPGLASNNQFGIDAVAHRFYVRSYAPNLPGNRRKALARERIQFDRWYRWRWQIKWSTAPDGFVNFWLDGKQIARWSGPTIPPEIEPPWMQFGFYGAAQKQRNEVRWARLRVG